MSKVQMKNKMKLIDTKYFKGWEITYSYVAEQNNIDNTPTDETIIDNLNYTLQRLNGIREGYGKPIIISSGYRCDELNEKVGGVNDSKHKNGLGVDLKWDSDLVNYMIDNCSFDKLIREKSGNTKWIHVQFNKDISAERHLVYYIEK